MGSSRGYCEIVEAKDEPNCIKRPQAFRQVRAPDRDQRPPIIKKERNKYLEDDINKLFESVNLRTSKSLDLSDIRRNPSKKPSRVAGSHSPGIGFSEPVSLKQALRGLCISQAAEMAAVKRSSMPSSPRISETLNQDSFKSAIQSSCSSPSYYVVKPDIKGVELKSKYGNPVVEGSGYGVGISTEERGKRTCASEKTTCASNLQEPKMRSQNQSVHSSPPALLIKENESDVHDDSSHASEVDSHVLEIVCSHEEKHTTKQPCTNSDANVSKPCRKNYGSSKVASGQSKDSSTPLRVAPKPKRKSKLQVVPSSRAVNISKDLKSTRHTSRSAVKPVIRNKNLVIIKKSKKATIDGNSKTSHVVNNGSDQLICQRCRCSLRDTSNGDSITDQVKNNMALKSSSEKADISQSSKSSNCDYFSSTSTSLSEESGQSGSTSSGNNRPHMSRDVRWGAINSVKKQYGFLGSSHFNLVKKLGSGDIGTIYLAELMGTNCVFAIKVMDNEFLERRKKTSRAQTEGEILRMLDHPFLPTLYAQFTSDNLSCLVMEFCPGGDLHVLRQKQPGRYFLEHAARFYLTEVLLALEYLHMLGIVYRDLKPENILVRQDGHIMLTDFDLSLTCSVNPTLLQPSTEPTRVSGPCMGSTCIDPFYTAPSSCFTPRRLKSSAHATHGNRSTLLLPQLVAEPTEARSNSFVGTHEYLAPEIIKGEGHGSAVDWWTFGVLLYELLYGKTPFKGGGNEETLANVVVMELRFPESPMVSFQARDLVRGLLVKEPERRLGAEMGAVEIKRHPFFEGVNWALIRCAVPPWVPEVWGGVGNGGEVEFELF